MSNRKEIARGIIYGVAIGGGLLTGIALFPPTLSNAQIVNPGLQQVPPTPANNDCAKFVVSGGAIQGLTTSGAGCGALASIALTQNHIFVGNASNNPADVAMSQDCTIVAAGAITCTKTNNVAFATSATTDTTNASNIASGTLGLARLALANGSIYIGNVSGNPAAQTISQDCTITNAGVITCTKTNNVAFAASATTDTTVANNISSGRLSSTSRLPAIGTGDFWVGDGTGTVQDVAMSKDCALISSGAITCTKTNNVAFAASATTDTTVATNISSGTLNTARLPSPFTSGTRQGSTSAFVTFNGAGPVSGHIATYDASGNIQDGGAAGTGTVTSVTCGTGLSGGTFTTTGTCAINLTAANNSLVSSPAISSSGFTDGPSAANGTSGTWFASGAVTILDTSSAGSVQCKLWDGTTIIAGTSSPTSQNINVNVALSGYLASPAANLRISCRASNGTQTFQNATANIATGASTVSAFRIQ